MPVNKETKLESELTAPFLHKREIKLKGLEHVVPLQWHKTPVSNNKGNTCLWPKTASDGEAPSLPLLPGPLWSVEVELVGVQSLKIIRIR